MIRDDDNDNYSDIEDHGDADGPALLARSSCAVAVQHSVDGLSNQQLVYSSFLNVWVEK